MPRRSEKRQHNLPASRLRLIGRERDLVFARDALVGTDGRILTLIGSGGCGKTRLALELASDLLPIFPGGVRLVELAPLAHAELVPQAVASALGMREQPGESLLVALVRVLSGRQVLLVLDNCEHVIDVCARLVEDLLNQCPQLRVLATSREALRISGEVAWRVPSLAVPGEHAGTEELLGAPAVQLFLERAQSAGRPLDPVASAATLGDICRRLEGLPLAIELAAARARTLGIDQIRKRLDDSVHLLVGGSRTAPTRQQTLRATLDWSYGLLGEAERAVFRRMAVFAGTCSLEAAEAVCAEGVLASSGVMDELEHLVDKSLVLMAERDGEARYRLLEPIRQYAGEKLAANGERDGASRRHALYYLGFAEARARDTNIGGPRRFAAAAELDREYPNLRAVLGWAVEMRETQIGLRLAGSLNFAWQLYGSTSEGLAWLARLVSLPAADEPTPARAWALLARTWLTMLVGDFTTARSSCREALAFARSTGEPLLEWTALHFSGMVDYHTGDVEAAAHHMTEATACARAASEPAPEASSLNMLVMIATDHGDDTAAMSMAERAVHLARAAGDAWTEGWALACQGRAALGRGQLDLARSALETGNSVARHLGQPASLMTFIHNLLGELETVSGQLDEAQAWLTTSAKLQHDGGERWMFTRTLDKLAALAAAHGRAERALLLAGAADALYESLGTLRTLADRKKQERWLVPLREVLGSGAVDTALSHGRSLKFEDVEGMVLGSDDTGAPRASAPARPAILLTARERQVAALLSRGLTNRQIASQLVVSERTVASHVEHLLNKLGFASRHQVGAWAADNEQSN